MKIQRLMLAVLAVCGTSAALAQSSVTIYGRVNTSVERQKAGDQTTTGMFNNASRIGFKGVEDLGGGLKAGFVLEGGFNSDDGAGTYKPYQNAAGSFAFKRQSEVNLSGNFGMVRLGRWTPETYYAVADFGALDEPNHDTGSSSNAFYQYLMRDDNKLAYRTPEFAGFWAEAAYSFHEKSVIKDSTTGVSTGVVDNKNAWDLAANYATGPLALGAGYTSRGKSNQFGLRAAYTVGALSLAGYFQRTDLANGSDYGFEGPKTKWNNYRLAATYAIGASEITANVGRADKQKVAGVSQSGTAATQWTLGYNYNLSKRTKVYTYYTRVNNGNNIDYNVSKDGDNFSSFALGIRHNF